MSTKFTPRLQHETLDIDWLNTDRDLRSRDSTDGPTVTLSYLAQRKMMS